MASVWWVVLAFFAGGLAGAILVALMSVNRREEDLIAPPVEPVDESQLQALM